MIRHRTLTALLIGCAMTLTGCHAAWQDRVDSRPMKYGSFRDKFAYWTGGPCDGYRPWYHCGAPDGMRDRCSVQHASVAGANQALAQQFDGGVSRDFEFGFQQAFLDIANGGSGALPAVPPPRYWTAPYRTTWGHNKARDWFEGYEAGASTAKCNALREAQSVPTSVYRNSNQQLAIGLDGGGGFATGSAPMNAAPMMAPATGWNGAPNGISPYPVNPYSASPYRALPPGAAYGPSMSQAPMQPPMTNPWPQMSPQMPFPQNGGYPVGPALNAMPGSIPPNYQPSYSPSYQPNYSTPIPSPPSPNGLPMMPRSGPAPGSAPFPSSSDVLNGTISPTSPWSSLSPSSGGHSIVPGAPPSSGWPYSSGSLPQSAIPQNTVPPPSGLPASNPWSRFMGFGPSGFRSEGASR